MLPNLFLGVEFMCRKAWETSSLCSYSWILSWGSWVQGKRILSIQESACRRMQCSQRNTLWFSGCYSSWIYVWEFDWKVTLVHSYATNFACKEHEHGQSQGFPHCWGKRSPYLYHQAILLRVSALPDL